MPKFSIGDVIAILTAVVLGAGVFFGLEGDVRKNTSDIERMQIDMREEIERVSQQSEDRFTETKALIKTVNDSIKTSEERSLERSIRLESKIDRLIERELNQ